MLAWPLLVTACAMINQAVTVPDPGDAEAIAEPQAASDTDAAPEAWIEPFSISVSVARADLPPQCHEYDAPRDLLERIRTGYAFSQENREAIDRHIAQYVAHPAYLPKVLRRAERYLHHIVEELDGRELPLELALLPVVESGFDPFAYSHGRAAGLWQFIPGTGRRYDLKQNWWYDGRRDVTASTRAALDYLEELHARFDGDWLLAVAAYNSGEGNVQRAIRRNIRANKPTDFWRLRLPRETKAYVPKLLAVRQIVADPARFGLTLPRLPDVPYFSKVETGSQIDLALAADLAETTVEEMYALNPGFNRWATDPDGPHRLLVPHENHSAFERALQTLPSKERTQWARYPVREGDSLSLIAKRHGTTPDVLKRVNSLRGDRIRAGQHLMIPKSARSAGTYTMSADSRLHRTMSEKQGENSEIYTVKAGDTLWEMGKPMASALVSLPNGTAWRCGIRWRSAENWSSGMQREALRRFRTRRPASCAESTTRCAGGILSGRFPPNSRSASAN